MAEVDHLPKGIVWEYNVSDILQKKGLKGFLEYEGLCDLY